MKLALVRAAAPAWGDRLVGSAELPLAPEGLSRAREAARRIADRGGAARIYAPPAGHAAEAAAAVAEALGHASVAEREDLAELRFGLWQGLAESELSRRHKTAFRAFLTDARAVVAPEGEEVGAAFDRLGKALAAIARRHAREARPVVVVVPEFAFALLAARLEGREAPAALYRERLAGDDLRFHEVT